PYLPPMDSGQQRDVLAAGETGEAVFSPSGIGGTERGIARHGPYLPPMDSGQQRDVLAAGETGEAVFSPSGIGGT
ncbi:hypothetical protein VS878_22275, partial [Salmonella enterica subsp. enterica serovar Paratyphi A]|nr:hypothetical protein [Salmonella enterica subsp. enterica serovar Paratyphi A]